MTQNLAKSAKDLLHLGIVPRVGQVLDVQVGVLLGALAKLAHAIAAALEAADEDLLLGQNHPVDLFNGARRRLLRLEMDETVAL